MRKEGKDKCSALQPATGIGFVQRDKNIREQEEKKLLDFRVVHNTGENTKENIEDNMKILTDLKNIIAKQLPKMPKEYIVRLVCDPLHESMVIIRSKFFIIIIFFKIIVSDKKVLGGVCYRPNLNEHFIEIAFLAISSLDQVKGYGTRLMNKLKDHCKEKGIKYFLTYADNNAIGYFKKQGFSKFLSINPETWKDLIKDYDGGTLMQAEIKNIIDYSNLSSIINTQKKMIYDYGDKTFLNHKRVHSFEELAKTVKSKSLDINKMCKKTKDGKEYCEISESLFNCIPGIKESGYKYKDYQNEVEKEKRGITDCFIVQCRNIVDYLFSKSESFPFRAPVDTKEFPDYKKIITEPMDLRTLKQNIESGLYIKKEDFVKDLKLIFSNAKTFNKVGSNIYKSAVSLEQEIEKNLNNLYED